jgi:hypothetical protein
LQNARCTNHRITNGVLCLTHTPDQSAWTILRHSFSNFVHLRFWNSTSFFYILWSPLFHNFFADLIHTVHAVIDVLLIFPTIVEDVIQNTKQEWDIST